MKEGTHISVRLLLGLARLSDLDAGIVEQGKTLALGATLAQARMLEERVANIEDHIAGNLVGKELVGVLRVRLRLEGSRCVGDMLGVKDEVKWLPGTTQSRPWPR